MAAGRIPVTVLTGFLGAGKTTLVRHMLTHANGKRIAVIVNEFGDIGFDGSLVSECGNETCAPGDIVELTNGCICCTVADDFVPTMEALLGRDRPLDAIVIETSGLALPQPLLKAFEWPAVRTRATVDGVITVVDATALAEGRIPEHDPTPDPARAHDDPVEEVFDDQLACADLVILSKTDLLPADVLAEVERRLGGELKPGIRIVRSGGGDLPLSVLTGIGAGAESDLANRAGHHGDGEDHDHDDFDTVVIETGTGRDPEAVRNAALAALACPGVLRVKGYWPVAGKAAPLRIQGVGSRAEATFARPGTEAGSGLVVIGLKGFDQADVARALAAGT